MTNDATNATYNTAIADALDQIANAATNNNSLLATMVAQLAALTTRLDTMHRGGATPATTTTTTPAMTTSTTPPAKTTTPRPLRTQRPPKVYTQADALRIFGPVGYCSMHGYRVLALNTSKTCRSRGPRHNENATWVDTMRGCKRNKGWETNPNPM